MIRLYRKFIGRFIFRKLNLGIGAALLLVFLLLGYLTYNSYYELLEQRESEVLRFRTERAASRFDAAIEQFKREVASLYAVQSPQKGTYEYFLPSNIPAATDQRALVSENQYFHSMLSLMLNRNPNAAVFYMYRNEDGKGFFAAGNSSFIKNRRFDDAAFFATFPKNYRFPYIGKLEGFISDGERHLIYFLNPVFEFNQIHYNQPFGYYMMGVDPQTLLRTFQAEQSDQSGRLLAVHEGVDLIGGNSASAAPTDNGRMIVQRVLLPKYDTEFIGMMDKDVISAKLRGTTALIVAILGTVWIVCIVMIFYIQRFVAKRFRALTQHFKKVQTNPFTPPLTDAGHDELGDLIEKFNRMTEQLQVHIRQVYMANLQKRNAEYFALKMQINPHFLYNTLESLRMQAVLNKQKALGEKLFILGKLFRWMLKSGDDLVPIEEELRYTEYYLELYMLGKAKRIDLNIRSDLDLHRHHVLKFSLQPIIENAVLHGQLENVDSPQIRIAIYGEDGILHIDIVNNGAGLSEDKREELNRRLNVRTDMAREHLGLINVHERTKVFFGRDYGLTILPIRAEEGFGVRLRLPLGHRDKGGETS